MKTKYFRWLFLLTLVPPAIWSFVRGDVATEFGASIEISDDKYRFAGGTAPWALVYAALVIALYILLLCSKPGERGESMTGVVRRFVAFWLDFMFGMMAIAPIVGIFPTLMEWKQTGMFEWNFERMTPAASDRLVVGIGVLLAFIGLAFFYAIPLMRQRPTPGTCIIGYQIVADEDGALTARRCLLRVLLGFIATCAWPIAPFIRRDKRKGKFWLDGVFKTRGVKLI